MPLVVDDRETIVRAIKTPAHHKKNNPTQLRPAAFKPPAGRDDLSVMRHGYLGTENCRTKAIAICRGSYVGLATILAGSVRSAGSDVVDTRQEFWGHADIVHGIVLLPDEPPESRAAAQLNERCKALVAATTMHVDPDSSAPSWTGQSLA